MKFIRRAILALALAAGMLLVGGTSAAFAASSYVAEESPPGYVLSLDLPQLLNLIVAVIFPVLVGLVTTRVTSSTVKALLLATISLASGFVSAWLGALIGGLPFDVVSALLTGLTAWVIAIATHFGIWKPTGVTAAVQAVGAKHLA